jgi:hypothetical protein
MFTIISNKRNTKQNYIEISSHPSQNGNHQENKQQKMLVMMQGQRNTGSGREYTVGI